MLQTAKILNVHITNERKKNILEYVLKRIKNPEEKTFIVTPNPEMLVYANKHLDYQDKLNKADIALPDGVGVLLAGAVLGRPLQERITGVDFVEKLCQAGAKLPLSIGFLGGKEGVAERAAECLLRKYPYLNIVFVAEEWGEKGFMINDLRFKNDNKGKRIINHKSYILNQSIDILFVAFGVPKQEEWIYKNLPKIPVKAAMGVGGAFDYFSGNVQRAPFIIRFLGFEWLYRLIAQPWRWKRQLALIEFVQLVFKEKFASK